MIGKINIIGPIGKYEENGKLSGVALIEVIAAVKALDPLTQIIEVHIASPGGYVDEGDNIYNYLESLKKSFVVNTVQDGNIASIATKLFLVGQDRKADTKFDFMIHNPWNDPGPGDANFQLENLEGLLAEEDKLRKFYSKNLDITEEGIKPLMDQETTLTAQQLMSLGFATSLKDLKVLAMKTEKKPLSISQRIAALGKMVGMKAKTQALDLNTDKGVLSIDAESEDMLVSAVAMLDGAPAPDGPYVTEPDAEGMSDLITVSGGTGVVESVVEQPKAQAKDKGDKMASLEAAIGELTGIVSSLVESNKAALATVKTEALTEAKTDFEAKIMALKTEIGTTHEPKKASTVYSDKVDKTKTEFKSISQRLVEKAQARKK